ncbi:MAG: DUF721 domain-containing protein [Oligoflexia bacterium]|nr:DUF721 domain-containing protein [Oligoflexia bacterium]
MGNEQFPKKHYSAPRRIFRAKSKLEKIEGVLRSALRGAGLDKEIARYSFVLHWPEIVGEKVAARTTPECIRNRALVVKVPDSYWAQELSFQKQVILKRLQRFINSDEIVEDVMFYVAG